MQTSGSSDPMGISVTRRVTLHGSWALPALWMLGRVAQGQAAAPAKDLEGVLRGWADRTSELMEQSDPNDEAHLHGLCADLARLDPGDFPARKAVTFQDKGMTSGPVFAQMPFIVIQFDLEPGAVIPAHNHVGWDFISFGAAGEATVRNFEPIGKAPDPGKDLGVEFDIREVSSCLLTRGRTSSLTRTRGNIHWFQAGEKGATFLDFGIKFPDAGDGPKAVSSLEFEAEPADRERRIHKARYIGNIYAKE